MPVSNRFSGFAPRCLLSVISGGIHALAFPPLGWGWLVFPGIAGLLLAVGKQQGPRSMLLGLLHGITAYSVGLFWLFGLFGPMAICLWMILAGFTVLFAWLQGYAGAKGWVWWKMAGFTAINWGAWEFIRSELFPLKFPWMTAGLAMGPNLLLPWIGVYGVGMIVVFAVALWASGRWKPALIASGILIVAIALCRPHSQPKADDPLAVKVAGLQWESVSFDKYVEETRKLPEDVRHVVWPEYAVPFDIRKNPRDWQTVQTLCRERNITLTMGTHLRPDDDSWRNIALTLDPEGVRGEHNKNHTVHLFDDGIPGTSAAAIPTRHGKTGTPICFDGDYEDVIRRMTKDGAEMILIPTMDAVSWGATQHDQHAALSRIRACENGRWILVCATSGVSQVIDPNGQLHERLPALAEGVMIGTLRRESALTFYTRFGWLTPWLVLGLAGAAWFLLMKGAIRDRLRERREKEEWKQSLRERIGQAD